MYLTRFGAASLSLSCGPIKRWAYAGRNRDSWQQSERVVAVLEIEPGARVADLGAGGGYFTFRLADAVGPEGFVYAVDVDDDMTQYLEERAADEGRDNVVTVLAAENDANLPQGKLDLVFTCNTYHHLEDRVAYWRAIAASLAPGGRVAVIDYRDGKHGTDPAVVREEMQAAGYTLLADHDFLERQGFLVFGFGAGAP